MEERIAKLEELVELLEKKIDMANNAAANLTITVTALENRVNDILKQITPSEEPKYPENPAE